MARFAEVGDIVTMTADHMMYFTSGRDYVVIYADDHYFDVKDDDGDTYSIYERERVNFTINYSNNELKELRAFRDRAIARFPALAEPETDAEAAERFAIRCRDDADDYGDDETYFADAIAWARANPR